MSGTASRDWECLALLSGYTVDCQSDFFLRLHLVRNVGNRGTLVEGPDWVVRSIHSSLAMRPLVS